jgi:hemerythrin superfamily protein
MHHDDDRIDAVTLLIQQHDLVRDLFEQVELATPSTRRSAFEPLVRILAIHETAEEIVVHPAVRGCGAEGEKITRARLAEEDGAKKLLAELERLEPASVDFMQVFDELRRAVLRHAELEERESFPLLVRMKTADELATMASGLRLAETLAPTHAHAGSPEGALGNLVVGPFLAVADRVRDLLRGRS